VDKPTAISKMIAPGQPRSKVAWRSGVIQIWVTRKCDLSCFNCTQGSNLRANATQSFITLEQFRTACESLKGYFGVVGMFGGNPAVHPQFEELCNIMQETIPFEQRGLWCNNPFNHGKKMRETFNPHYSNLNVHLSQAAFDKFKRDWPESEPFGLKSDSRHSPVFYDMQSVVPSEDQRWDLISNCDINQTWSAMIGVFRDELRAWFCEIAGSQSINLQHIETYPDTGVEVSPGWWKRPIQDFEEQISWHCHRCGIPLRGYGELSQADNLVGTETMSEDYSLALVPKIGTRKMSNSIQAQALGSVVNYIGNATK
jgi:hypothetical protein